MNSTKELSDLWGKLFPKSVKFVTPYLWLNKLNKSDYFALKYVLKRIVDNGDSKLLIDEHADKIALFVAEWYKWEFSGNSSDDINAFVSIGMDNKAKEICENCFLKNYQSLFYKEGNTTRWLFSLYVLGGWPLNYQSSNLDY